MRKLEDREKWGENTSLVTLGHLHAARNAELPAKPKIANRGLQNGQKGYDGGHNGEKQVCFKMLFRQNKVF